MADYLRSTSWNRLRQAIRERSGGWCERCGILSQDLTHHLTYDRVPNERLDDLQAACVRCHDAVHGIGEYGGFDPHAWVKELVDPLIHVWSKERAHDDGEGLRKLEDLLRRLEAEAGTTKTARAIERLVQLFEIAWGSNAAGWCKLALAMTWAAVHGGDEYDEAGRNKGMVRLFRWMQREVAASSA